MSTDHLEFFKISLTGNQNFKDPSKTSQILMYHYHSQAQRCSFIDLETYIYNTNKILVILIFNIRGQIFKYSMGLIRPVGGKILKMPFNVILPLMMKAATVGCVLYKFSKNLYKRKHSAYICKTICFLSE